MVKEKEAFLGSVAKVVDSVCIVISFVYSYFITVYLREFYELGEMAFAISPNFEGLMFFARKNFIIIASSIPVWIMFLSFHGAYKDIRTRSLAKEFEVIFKAAIFATLTLGSFIFIFKLTLTSRLFIGVNAGVALILLMLAKILQNQFFDYIHSKGYNQVNILIVGTGKRAQDFIRVVKKQASWGLKIVGLIDDEHGMYGKDIEGFRVLGRLQDIPFILHRIVVDRVIFVVPRLWLNRIDDAILACEREGISTSISMDLYNLRIAKVRQTDFSGFPLLEFETF